MCINWGGKRMEEDTLKEALKHAPFGYALHEMLFDAFGKATDFKWSEVNHTFETFFNKHDMQNNTYVQMFKDDPLDFDWVGYYADMLETGKGLITEKYIRQIGKWVMVYAYPFDSKRFVSFLFNVSKRKSMDKRETLLKDALDLLDTHIYMKDKDSRYFYANKPTRRLFGVNEETLIDKTDHDFFAEETVKILRNLDLKILRGERTRQEIETKDRSGNKKHYLEIKAPIYDSLSAQPEGIIGISTDITEKKEMEEKINYLIDHDSLTGIFTRRKVFETLEAILEARRDFSLAILDVDLFKNVNDTYGHLVGDKVLQKFVRRLQKLLDDTDIIGRFGGEEFIVIFNGKHKAKAKASLQNVLDSLNESPIVTEDNVIELSFSGGLCTPNEVEETSPIKSILALADKRLYKAKNNGRKQIFTD